MRDRVAIPAYLSIALTAFVVFLAWVYAPDEFRPLSLICASAAMLISRQAALRDPATLTWALLASAPPVMALSAGRSTAWLVAPLAVLLLVAAELNALGWDLRGATETSAVERRRLRDIGKLAVLGLTASALVGLLALGPSVGGTLTVVLAAGALAGVGWVVFGAAPGEPDP